MRSNKTVLLVIAAAAIASLASARVSVRSDHQNGIDFAAYQTFALGPGTPATITEIQNAVESAIVAGFTERGLAAVEEGGDLEVVIHAPMASQEEIETDSFGYGGRDWAGWRVWGPTSVNLRVIRPGTLVVDLLDAESRELVWRGVAKEALTGKVKKLPKRIGKAAAELTRDFPPEPEG